MSVGEQISALVLDIKNNSEDAARMVDRKCVWDWQENNMDGLFKFKLFHDDY